MRKLIVLISIVLFPSLIFGQRMDIVGSLDFINNIESMQVIFDYEKVSVGDFNREEDYVKREVTEKEDKEPGSGQQWQSEWYGNRQSRYEPKFIELFNEFAIDYGKSITIDEETEFVMLVKTRFIEPGWNIGISRQPALVSIIVEFYNRSDPNNNLAKIGITKCPGRGAMGYDFDTGYRIQEAYAKAGKSLAKFIRDRVAKGNKKKKKNSR